MSSIPSVYTSTGSQLGRAAAHTSADDHHQVCKKRKAITEAVDSEEEEEELVAKRPQASKQPEIEPSSSSLPTTPFDTNSGSPADKEHCYQHGGAAAVEASSSSMDLAIAPDCHMLRAFSRDQDSWFALLHKKLNLTDIAHLYSTSRTCKGWIGQPSKLLLASKRARVVLPASLQLMSTCNWVRPFLMQVKVNMRPTVMSIAESLHVPPPLASTFSEVVTSLACFPQLTRVGLQMCSMDAGRAEMRECFQKLKHIQHLELLMVGVGAMPSAAAGTPIIPAVTAAFLELDALTQLESFSVSNLGELPSKINFESLTRLPVLKQLGITISRGPSASAAGVSVHRSFHATADQSKCLAQCKQLVDLRCGVWSLPMHLELQLNSPAPTAELRQRCKAVVDASIGALIDGKICALRAAPGYSTSSSDPAPSALPLQQLHLDGTVISSQVWTHLSQMHSLTTLAPHSWRSDLTAAQWASLSKFRHLRSFSLLTHPLDEHGANPITADMFLPHLLQCTQLKTLHLQSVKLSRAQLTDIVTRLPNLAHLSMRSMELESVAPLTHASKLQILSLHFCTQPPPTEVDPATSSASSSLRVLSFRESLPGLPHLTALMLHDRVRITPDAAAPLNAVLLEKCPKLKPTAFHQNLLDATAI